jgi:hypothetical protein
MTWRTHFQTLKAAPKLNMGVAITQAAPAYTPSTALGWRDHYQDQRKAQLTDVGTGKTGVADQVAQHLTDNPDHQASIAGAITSALGG